MQWQDDQQGQCSGSTQGQGGCPLWVIAGSIDDLLPEIRYGLTLLCLSIRAERPELSILWVDSDGQLSPELLQHRPALAAMT
jgi:hypothetical protein